MRKVLSKTEIWKEIEKLLNEKKEILTSSQEDIEEAIHFLSVNGVDSSLIPEKIVKAVQNPSEVVLIDKDGKLTRKTGGCITIHSPLIYSFCTNLFHETGDELLEEILYEGNIDVLTQYLVSKEYIVFRIFFEPFTEEVYMEHTQLFPENQEQMNTFETWKEAYVEERTIDVNHTEIQIPKLDWDSSRISR